MDVVHIAAECYPAAKVGGLGDVVGALPKYLNKAGLQTAVIMPAYRTPWLLAQPSAILSEGVIRLNEVYVPYAIRKVDCALGFDLLTADIPGFLDRPGIYADIETGFPYHDEVARYLLFQQAALHFLCKHHSEVKVVHCHDHHTGLIPFMMRHCPDFTPLRNTPSIFTIHNGLYQGAFGWDYHHLLPYYDASARGLLDWNYHIHPMASAIRCAWAVTTVSNGYLSELMHQAPGLTSLFQQEQAKCHGIVNGIDNEVWNPITDPLIKHRLSKQHLDEYKQANKAELVSQFGMDPHLPLIAYIGRLVQEKGADILAAVAEQFMQPEPKAQFLFLGSGDTHIENMLRHVAHQFAPFVQTYIGYNEMLSHQIYAGADFLIMPSRTEPCGLNQLYALRYGTVPVVRKTGGLAETIIDVGDDGFGFTFVHASPDDAAFALFRACELYTDEKQLLKLRKKIMALDHSWEKATTAYIQLYQRYHAEFI